MLTKLSILLHKVPGYVLLAAVAISVYGPQLIDVLTGTPLAAYSKYIQGAVTIALAVLTLAKQFPPGSPPALAHAKAIAEIAAKKVTQAPVVQKFTQFACAGLLVMLAACKGSVTPAQVQQTLSPAERCLALDAIQIALSGAITDPVAAADALLAACLGTTIDDLLQLLDDLQGDGGTPPPGVAALRAELLKRKAKAPASHDAGGN